MADDKRRVSNSARMRELINLVERKVYGQLRESEHFDVTIHVSVKDGVIQPDVKVSVTDKRRLGT